MHEDLYITNMFRSLHGRVATPDAVRTWIDTQIDLHPEDTETLNKLRERFQRPDEATQKIQSMALSLLLNMVLSPLPAKLCLFLFNGHVRERIQTTGDTLNYHAAGATAASLFLSTTLPPPMRMPVWDRRTVIFGALSTDESNARQIEELRPNLDKDPRGCHCELVAFRDSVTQMLGAVHIMEDGVAPARLYEAFQMQLNLFTAAASSLNLRGPSAEGLRQLLPLGDEFIASQAPKAPLWLARAAVYEVLAAHVIMLTLQPEDRK